MTGGVSKRQEEKEELAAARDPDVAGMSGGRSSVEEDLSRMTEAEQLQLAL